MKKITLLGALLVATTMQAQKTFYWPGQRVSELTNDQQYFIYNTGYDPSSDPNDRGSFIYAQEKADFGTVNPKKYANEFITNNANYVFTITNKEGNVYQIKNASGSWINFTGRPSETAVDFYIQPWATSTASKANIQAKGDDGTLISDLNTAKVWTVTNNASNSNAWNGNGGFTTWSNAHPYAFYEINTIDYTANELEAIQNSKSADGFILDLSYQLQTVYGLVQNGDKFHSNYKQSGEGSYDALIDNDPSNYFHSAWDDSKGEASDPAHYLRAELSNAVNSFRFIYGRRDGASNDFPTKIKIEGSNDDQNYSPITTIETGLPTNQTNNFYYVSDEITSETAYKYIRFTPTETTSSKRFFHIGSLFILQTEETVNQACEAMQQIVELSDLSIKENETKKAAATAYTAYNNAKSVINTLTKIIKIAPANTSEVIFGKETIEYKPLTEDTYTFTLPTYAFRNYVNINVVGATASVEDNTVTLSSLTNNVTVKIIYEDALPFTVSENFENATWQQIKIRNGHFWTLSDDLSTATCTPQTNDNPFDAKQMWCITGNLDDGFKIQNMAAGASKYLTYGANNPVMGNDENDLWTIANTSATDAAYKNAYCFAKKGTTSYINQSGTSLIYYGYPDAGSANLSVIKTAEEMNALKQPVVDQYTAEINERKENQARVGSISEATATELNSKLAEFDGNANATTFSAFINAYTNAEKKEFDPTKFYRIENAGTTGKYIVLGNDGLLTIENPNESNASELIKFESTATEGTYYIKMQNAYLGDFKKYSGRIGLEGQSAGDNLTYEKGTFSIETNVIKQAIKNVNNKTNGYDNYAYFHYNTNVVAWERSNPQTWWYLEEANTCKITISDAGYATINYPFAVELPDDLTAYTGGTISDNQIVLNAVEGRIIPANSPVILAGTAGTYTLTILPENTDAKLASSLQGTLLPQTIEETTTAYVLAKPVTATEVGFYKLNDTDRTIGANKAYLTVTAPAGIKAFTFDFGGTTGIENTEAVTEAEEYYDLQGRRVMNPTKGIYVTKSGKKVLFTK